MRGGGKSRPGCLREEAKFYVKRVPAHRAGFRFRSRGSSGLLAQLALRSDVPVERHGFDTELPAKRGHGGVAVRHRGLGQPHLRFRQRELPAAVVSARPRGREPGQSAFADQLPLELTLRRSSWPTWREHGLPACGALMGCGGLHSTFRERRYSQANFTAKRNATAINVGEHSPRRPAITLIKT